MNWLSDIRQQNNMSQCDVALKADITQQFYNYIENGERRPSVKTAKKIAAALGFDWTRFFEDIENKTS